MSNRQYHREQQRKAEENRKAFVTVIHSCGHDFDRPVEIYNPYKKTWHKFDSAEYLEGMGAPKNIIENARQLFDKRANKTIEYWSQRLCPSCYKGK